MPARKGVCQRLGVGEMSIAHSKRGKNKEKNGNKKGPGCGDSPMHLGERAFTNQVTWRQSGNEHLPRSHWTTQKPPVEAGNWGDRWKRGGSSLPVTDLWYRQGDAPKLHR